MRFVPSISPVTTRPNTRQVTGLSGTRAVQAVQPHEQPVPFVVEVPHTEYPKNAYQVEPNEAHTEMVNVPVEDRRKACRRVHHQMVLIELRSGIDRRHHNLREGDVAEHIDIEA